MVVIVGLFLLFFLGLSITLLIIPKMDFFGRIGLSYILGMGLFTLAMTGMMFGGISLSGTNILTAILLIDFAFYLLVKDKLNSYLHNFRNHFDFKSLTRSEKIFTLLLLLLNIYALIASIYWPVKDWDAVTLYDFRGKLIANPDTIKDFLNLKLMTYYYGYPLLTSLSHSFVYILGGDNPLFLSGLFFVSLSLTFYGAIREFTSRVIGLLMTLILVTNYSLVQHTTTAYSNLPFTVYFGIGTIYLYIWMQKRMGGYFVLASLLTMLSIWVRDSEPFWMANLLVLIVYGVYYRRWLPPILFSLIVSPLWFLWSSFKNQVSDYVTTGQFQKSYSILTNGIDFNRIGQVITFLGAAIIPLFLPIIILSLYFLLIDMKKIIQSKRIFLVMIILANFGVLFLGTYIFSFTFPDWMKITGSVERLFMFFPVLLTYFVGLALNSERDETITLNNL